MRACSSNPAPLLSRAQRMPNARLSIIIAATRARPSFWKALISNSSVEGGRQLDSNHAPSPSRLLCPPHGEEGAPDYSNPEKHPEDHDDDD